jgi:cation-transporting ATPase E
MSVAEAPEIDEGFLQHGLSAAEVEAKRAQGLANTAHIESSRTYGRILWDNAINPIHVTLFVISGLLLALELPGDAFLTAGLVLGNIVVGVFQEGRAKRQLDRIALLTKPHATVIRDGETKVIDPTEIVQGDLIKLTAGDQIQVDGPVLEATGFSVDEALLTGEADLVRKSVGEELHSGTFCMTGEGSQLAETVGAGTVSYKITARARAYESVRTPLQREVGIIIWLMAALVTILALLVANSLVNVYDELPLVETTRAAAVVVALVPQGLWFMITVAYSMAVVRTARSGVLIQRLNAVESISRVDVLCLDKTGTLTSNALAVEAVQGLALTDDDLKAKLGTFAASASFRNRTSSTLHDAFPAEARPVTQEVVFDSSRKWSALIIDGELMVLGAPEVLKTAVVDPDAYAETVTAFAAQGLRVLLFAGRQGVEGIEEDGPEALGRGTLTAYGLIVLRDELRKDAKETVERFTSGGVALKIMSGDNPGTVAALAKQAGFSPTLTALPGSELAGLDDNALQDIVHETTVFGRVTPDDKERLVQALQRRGRFVAMIGDGVNDIPALKAAQVAAVMRSGSPATRSVADIVLMEDSFSALSKALLEGQRIRQGMESIFRVFLSRTLAISLVILLAALMSDPFPVTPRQSAIMATLTVGIPAIALASWATPGQSPHWLLPGAVSFVAPVALTIGLVGYGLYEAFLQMDASLDEARTALTMFTVLAGISLIPFSVVNQNRWLTIEPLRERRRLLHLSGVMVLFYVIAAIQPDLRSFYELEPLNVMQCAGILATVVGWALLLRGVVHFGLDEWLGRVTERFLERRATTLLEDPPRDFVSGS